MNEKGEALLCDFGLSRIRHEVTRTRTDIRSGGMVAYLAPELLAGPDRYRTTEASDVYAMAMTFVGLGTLLPPFHGVVANEFKLSNLVQDGLRPAAPTTLGNLPLPKFQELWSMMQGMWASAEQRTLTSARIHVILLQLASGTRFNASRVPGRESETPNTSIAPDSLRQEVRVVRFLCMLACICSNVLSCLSVF
jgi:serine/threonine protein kinase